jgi:hypothetical protein
MTIPTLAYDRQPVMLRAHRMRGSVTANLVRDFIRWISVASR